MLLTCVIFGTKARAIWPKGPLTVSIRTALDCDRFGNSRNFGGLVAQKSPLAAGPVRQTDKRVGTKAGHRIVMGRAPKPSPLDDASPCHHLLSVAAGISADRHRR